MDTKQLFISLSFALITTMLINYFVIDRFFTKDTQEVKSGQAFHVTLPEQMNKPLATEVNFLDEDIVLFTKNQPKITIVSTPYSDISFSEQGATIHRVICKKVSGHVEKALEIISPSINGTQRSFLVAFEKNTPLQYVLKAQEYADGVHTLIYESESILGKIIKKYNVYDAGYSIDMILTIEPHGSVAPRIIFPAPQLAGVEKTGYYDLALVNNQKDSLQRLKSSEITDKAFAAPTLSGCADRYFVNALVKSSPAFAQRSYFFTSPIVDSRHDLLECIVEGPEVSVPATFRLCWYCGPKEYEPLEKSDPRLTELLDYGWFTLIARPLLAALKFLYNYVHNFGFAIIILTVLLNLLMLPFTSRGEKSMQKMGDFSKKMQYIEQKYKHDKERLAQEKSELMQKHGNFDALGCLSFILQTFFFIGLNKVLSSSVELYNAPFYGWITDLSAKDPLYILPLCVFLGIALPLLLKPSGSKFDVRQNAITFGMALLISGFMTTLSAGLVLFILTNIVTRIVVTETKKLFA
ncbi:MAG: membrane protein insertase YidC [Candidatus Babeliaceae bacterium]|nr:membrane protein insertase YidC [Candidatus Babeliaceae bacterium]